MNWGYCLLLSFLFHVFFLSVGFLSVVLMRFGLRQKHLSCSDAGTYITGHWVILLVQKDLFIFQVLKFHMYLVFFYFYR